MIGGVPLGTLEATGAAPGVLGLHGFGATPEEVRMIVELARELGLRALAPLLPGHGQSVHALAVSRWSDWRRGAEAGLDALLKAGAGPVIVVGSSMGSLLALELAADRPDDVLAIGILASPIRLRWPFPALGLQLMAALGLPDFALPKAGVDIRDAVQRHTQVTYDAHPAYAGNELRLAGRRLEARLGEIRCPAFIAHGRRDHVCPVNNARRVYAGLGTPAWEKELLILPRSYHIITRDIERGQLRMHLHRFLSRVLPLSRAQRAAEAPGAGAEGAVRPQRPVDPYPPAALPVSDRLSASSN
jgi:carboxylesterase